MPVWNGEEFVLEAVKSVLNQSYSNIELIIVNDCSTDGTGAIVSSVRDSRVRILTNTQNRGIAISLLRGIENAQGDYIARIDSDDVCLLSRIGRQVRFLERNPDVDVLGGSALLFGRPPVRLKFASRRDGDIKAELLFRCALIHPSLMFRRSSIDEWYDPQIATAEDYDLWVRLMAGGAKFANLRTPVIRYRLHSKRTSEVRAREQIVESSVAQVKAATFLLGHLTDSESFALRVLSGHHPVCPALLADATNLALQMLRENDRRLLIEPKALRRRVVYELLLMLSRNLQGIPSLDAVVRLHMLRLVLANPGSVIGAIWYSLLRAPGHFARVSGSES